MNYVDEVREFIVENFLFGRGETLDEDRSFFKSGVIDSTGVIELVTFLEERYKITIEDEELIPENLDSLGKVSRFLERKCNGHLVEAG